MKKIIPILIFLFSINVFSQDKVDYRSIQSPVKNQGLRGTCSAFAVAAAIEVLPNTYPDLSERYIYACMKIVDFMHKDFEEGAYLRDYVVTLPKYGVLKEAEMPYNPIWTDTIKANDHSLRKIIIGADVGPVSLYAKYVPLVKKYVPSYAIKSYPLDSLRNPEFVKRLLKKYKSIPVGYHIYLGGWQKGVASITKPITISSNGYEVKKLSDNSFLSMLMAKRVYGESFFQKIVKSNREYKLSRLDTEPTHYGGHAVNIVGYDGDYFIIKNSWGDEWGDNGYAYLSFDFHKIYANDMITIESILDKK